MSNQKFIAIGDIHGCHKTTEALLNKLDDYQGRKFVFVGDYIDRGPASKEVVDLLLEFKQEKDCVFLRGNHEQMLLDAYEGKEESLWMMNGGEDTLDSYGKDSIQPLPEEHFDFYKNTLPYYDTEDYFFVHAGLSPAKTIAESIDDPEEQKEFLWERSHLNAIDNNWEKTVIFGHTPRPQPLVRNNMIGIDTGCVYQRMGYGTLTAVKLPEVEFVKQKALD